MVFSGILTFFHRVTIPDVEEVIGGAQQELCEIQPEPGALSGHINT
jgi:hypothetical protein